MSVSEPTARKAMNELRGAGLVMQEKRGQGRSNRYHLLVKPKDSFVQDQNVERVEEEIKEEHQEIPLEDSIAKNPDILSLDTRETTKQPSAHESSPSPIPAPQLDEVRMAIFPFVKDIARELHDEASLSATTTRAVRLYRKANVSIEDFQTHLLVARQTTQERSASIKKSRQDGVKVKVPYFFAVLEKTLFGDSQSSHSSTLPYPQSPPLTRYFPVNHTNPSVQGKRDFWNERE
jgi:DNA primase catalytic subunit